MQFTRRRLFGFLAAPAIVRAASLMPVSVWHERLPRSLYFNGDDYWRVAQHFCDKFVSSIAEPLPEFLDGVSLFGTAFYCDPTLSTQRDAMAAEKIIRGDWRGAARLAV